MMNELNQTIGIRPCDDWCPEVYAGGDCAGLPHIQDVLEMREQKKVWMCHSRPHLPCAGTGLVAVPVGWEKVTKW